MSAKPIRVEAAAADEIEAAVAWYEARRPGLGSELLNELDRAIGLVEVNPSSFALVAGVRPELGARRALLRRFPFAHVPRAIVRLDRHDQCGMIEDVREDLLAADVEALGNAVNTVGVNGKCIALQFKRKFPRNFEVYEAACKAARVEVGAMLVVETGARRPRFIINFPTKRHGRSPSQLEYVRAGLEDLVKQVRERDIQSLAIPALGCGLGGLDWSDVRPLIVNAFASLQAVRVRPLITTSSDTAFASTR